MFLPGLHDTSMRNFSTLLLLLLLSLPASPAEFQETLSVEVVQVYLSALDSDRRFVTNLQPEDFIVKEDGEVQEILDFTNFSTQGYGNSEEALPLTIAFSMDISGSMSGLSKNKVRKIDLAKKAALELVAELQPKDQMTVYGFHYLPKVIVPLTSDPVLIKQKLKNQQPVAEETALFDSLHIIVDQLKKEGGRKIIVVGSDGVDTSSHISFESLLQNLRTSDVTILAFGMGSSDPKTPDKRYVLEKLAEASGGYAFFPESDRDLNQIMQTIRRIIRSQYSIWYRSNNEQSGEPWREINVSCKRGDVELRYRNGYYTQTGVSQTATE